RAIRHDVHPYPTRRSSDLIGTKVTIVEYLDRIVPVEDEEISKQLERSLKKSGIQILTSAEVTAVDTAGKVSKVQIKTAKGTETRSEEHTSELQSHENLVCR